MDRLAPLFLRQGFVASSSEEPFDDYLVQGMGKSPMVMIYESQFIQRAAAADGSITAGHGADVPGPDDLLEAHVRRPDAGRHPARRLPDQRSGDAVAWRPQYGFRTTDTAAFTKFVADHKLAVPATLINVIDPPTYETLEAMITRLEAAYSGAGPARRPVRRVAVRRAHRQ